MVADRDPAYVVNRDVWHARRLSGIERSFKHRGGGQRARRRRGSRPITLTDVTDATAHAADKIDRQALILEAVLTLLSEHGISSVSMRAVAREANVALGLVNYYFEDKTTLIAAALRHIEAHDLAIVEPDPTLPPEERVRAALRRIADPEFLTTRYLALRLQLWALAQADEAFAGINAEAQARYRVGLARLIRAARPELTRVECNRRATDINILQNGIWLTALLGLDRASIRRAVARSEQIALT